MKIAAVLTSLVASASAFAPSKQAGSSNTALFAKDFSQELGAMAPVRFSCFECLMVLFSAVCVVLCCV